MKNSLLVAAAISAVLLPAASAAIITVTSTNNADPNSLLQALTAARAGDQIHFNIPGPGPHFIETPAEGYPLITNDNIVIDGYTQPGATPNTNPILAPNNAAIKIVLDSRQGNSRLMDFAPEGPNDQTGYGDTESAVIGVLGAKGFVLRGVSILGVPFTGVDASVSLYGVSFAKGASGRVSGCWIGVAPDRQTVAGPADGVTGFRYRQRNDVGEDIGVILIDEVLIGVPPGATNAPADFNVLAGIPAIPVIIEGNRTRISGNFFGVMPDGLTEVNLSFDPLLTGSFEGFIEIGRAGNHTLIGTDGDGVNDANERNIFGGTVPESMGGYGHSIEFYGQNPGTNIVIAGNYFGVGIDGLTRFTNGVPVLNAGGARAQYRFGSNLDGTSDELEANVVFNYWPDTLFPPQDFVNLLPENLNFFDELEAGGAVSLRGNKLVNNLPFPAAPTRGGGGFLQSYYTKALADPAAGVVPVLDTNSTATRIRGTVPVAFTTDYPTTIIDLYIADPEGLATGIAAGIPDFPNGFVQGERYLASFVDNSAADLNPAAGAFEFDITSLGLREALLTITANYSQGNLVPANPVVITSPFAEPVRVAGGVELRITSIELTAQGAIIRWSGAATLQAAAQVTGVWQDVPGATSPHTVPAAAAARFFRLRR